MTGFFIKDLNQRSVLKTYYYSENVQKQDKKRKNFPRIEKFKIEIK